jgi:uncharacterized integral membrane protein
MTRRIVGWLVLVPLCLILIVFALSNTQLVNIYFNPFVPHLPNPQSAVPLFFVLFGVLLLGVVLGGVATWFAQSHHRRDLRSYRRESERLASEVDAMRRGPGSLGVDDLVKP